VVFVTNQRPANVSVTIRLAGFQKASASLGHTFSLYRTSAVENFALVKRVVDGNKLGSVRLNAQAQSLGSIVVSNVFVSNVVAVC